MLQYTLLTDGLHITQALSQSTTSLVISWTLEETLSATGYSVSYTNTNNTDCFTDSGTISGIPPGSKKSHILDGLQKGTEYFITVTATLAGQWTEQDTITATTLTAG